MTVDHKKVLDLIRQGEWNAAHKMIQPYSDNISCLIHGYLHRIEGDLSNAEYWYKRADITMPDNSLENELTRIEKLIDTT